MINAQPKPVKKPKEKKPLNQRPRCKRCGHSAQSHSSPKRGPGVCFCPSCTGYVPARGIRQQRRGTRAALQRRCNELWSLLVRSRPGGCECPKLEHGKGPFQGCHGFGKKAYPSVRHLLINGWKMTAGCHRWYTDHSIEWEMVMRSSLGDLAYEELRRLALLPAPPLEETVSKLAAEARARGISF